MIKVGIDEAGIGCWAGPLVVVSVALKTDTKLPKNVRDSKRLSAVQRENLIDDIYDLSEWVIIKVAHSGFIDGSRGIWSVWDMLVEDIINMNKIRECGKIMVDGTRMISSCKNVNYEAKADDKYAEVSAASIVAKYVQTCHMEDIHDQFPDFGFNKHHGYGTTLHSRMMDEHGLTPAHRLSYKPVADRLYRPAVTYDLAKYADKFCSEPTTIVLGGDRL